VQSEQPREPSCRLLDSQHGVASTANVTTESMDTPNIPGYTNLEKIGAGGFAVVYSATQESVGRQVALKLLHNASADEDTERRFQRECRVVGSLSWHPHIAAVLDGGVDEDRRSYLAFELLTGGSLGDRLQESGPIPWREAVVFAIQTADALAAAHEEHVLHRDIKPDNILIDRLGRAKLADFGIAAMRDGTQTKTGVITATLAHAAPEILNGKRATKLSDVYLLGSTLFELIAGEPPFGNGIGDDFFAAIQRIATEAPPTLVSRDGLDVPVELSALVAQCLLKDPHERVESAGAFGMALREIQTQYNEPHTPMPFVQVHGLPDRALPDPPVVPGPSVSPVVAALPDPPVVPYPVSPPVDAVAPRASVLPDSGTVSAGPIVPGPPSGRITPLPPPPVGQRAMSAPPLAGAQAASVSPGAADGAKHKRKRWILLVLLLILLGVGGVVAAVLLSPAVDSGIVALEVRQTDSVPGFVGDNVIDGDLGTGWLSPNNPDGHELVIGFGRPVTLDSIVIHSGPNPEAPGSFSATRGVGQVVLEFSDGTERMLTLDEAAPRQTVVILKSTSSLGIRSIAPGFDPVAIREVEFIGTAAS
jgi:serine/threonine protein kinase